MYMKINQQNKITIENYGVYCGRYNLEKNNMSQTLCQNDPECEWKKGNDHTGWCTNSMNHTNSNSQLLDEEFIPSHASWYNRIF